MMIIITIKCKLSNQLFSCDKKYYWIKIIFFYDIPGGFYAVEYKCLSVIQKTYVGWITMSCQNWISEVLNLLTE